LKEAPVRIIVGDNNDSGPKETFFIDAGALRQGGSFFSTALKKQWKEGQEGCIELPEEEAWIFGLYAQWLYTGKFFSKSNGEEDTANESDTLCKLYALGEVVMDRVFQDRTLDALYASISDPENPVYLPGANSVNYICQETPSDSPARRLLLDLVVRCCSRRADWPAFLDKVNHAFLADVVLAMADNRPITGSNLPEAYTRKTGCRYHHHPKDQSCPAVQPHGV